MNSRHEPNQPQGNIGWANIPMFNNFPYFQMPQFPFPQLPFPNFNYFPNFDPNFEQGNVPLPSPHNHHPHHPNMFPMPPTSTDMLPDKIQPISIPNSAHSSTFDHRVNQERPYNINNNNNNDDNGFSTNNFFESTDDRQWSNEEEKQWQATTKKPFFENTVPGNLKLVYIFKFDF